jgi:hypothetical protein
LVLPQLFAPSRAAGQHGLAPDITDQSRRNKAAAKGLLRKHLKGRCRLPRSTITNKLASTWLNICAAAGTNHEVIQIQAASPALPVCSRSDRQSLPSPLRNQRHDTGLGQSGRLPNLKKPGAATAPGLRFIRPSN